MGEGDDEGGKKAWWKMIEEESREELQLLEDQHPNHYHHLKLELKSFISSLVDSQQNQLCHPPFPLPPPSLIYHTHHSDPNSNPTHICTQASTTNSVRISRKRVRRNEVREEKDRVAAKPCQRGTVRVEKKKDTVEAAIDRARDCLLKIRTLKKQLLPQRS